MTETVELGYPRLLYMELDNTRCHLALGRTVLYLYTRSHDHETGDDNATNKTCATIMAAIRTKSWNNPRAGRCARAKVTVDRERRPEPEETPDW